MGWRTHFVQETHCFVQPLCSLCASTVCFSYLKKHKIHMKTTTPWINGYGLKWPALCGILWASGTLQFCYAIPISSHDITTILGSVPITILLCFLTYIVSIYIYSYHIGSTAIPAATPIMIGSMVSSWWLSHVISIRWAAVKTPVGWWLYGIILSHIYIYIPRESKTFNF